jgi:hypothetical protein
MKAVTQRPPLYATDAEWVDEKRRLPPVRATAAIMVRRVFSPRIT